MTDRALLLLWAIAVAQRDVLQSDRYGFVPLLQLTYDAESLGLSLDETFVAVQELLLLRAIEGKGRWGSADCGYRVRCRAIAPSGVVTEPPR